MPSPSLQVVTNKTLADAWLAGVRPVVACKRGKRAGPVKIEPCGYRAELSLETLLWTRGPGFPIWRLASRLMCPRCGWRSVGVAWMPGPPPPRDDAARLFHVETVIAGRALRR